MKNKTPRTIDEWYQGEELWFLDINEVIVVVKKSDRDKITETLKKLDM